MLITSSTNHNSDDVPAAPLKVSEKRLRKTKSHGTFITPLVRLARNPVESLEGIIETVWTGDHADQSKSLEAEDAATRKLVLQQRMKDVSAIICMCH